MCVCESLCVCVFVCARACAGVWGRVWGRLLPGQHASRPVPPPPTGRALLSEMKLAKVPRSGSRHTEAWLLPPAPAEPPRPGRVDRAVPVGSSRHPTARSPLCTSWPTPAEQNGPPCGHHAQHPAPELTGPPLQKGGSQDQGSGLGAPPGSTPQPHTLGWGWGCREGHPAPHHGWAAPCPWKPTSQSSEGHGRGGRGSNSWV